MKVINIAIIAHVDHGKTTLTDALMRLTGLGKEGVSMDSNALELERGITIYAKNASLFWKGQKINIVDTPGHADFGSEVERVLRSIDTVLLLVDAQEGPMPQTRFVLKKSLELGLKPIVIINKIDKPAARPAEVHEEVLELFMELNASDEQLNFTTVYASGRGGFAKRNLNDATGELSLILDVISEKTKPASADENLSLRMQPFNLAYDNFLGRMGIGRIYEGKIKVGDTVYVKNDRNENSKGKVTKLFLFEGIGRKEAPEAVAGDIAMVAGLEAISIGDTISTDPEAKLLPAIAIDEPTISLNFFINDSPFAGREGKFVTSRQLSERLRRELEVNVGLKVDFTGSESFLVYGRGELHIGILLENMRREGYEVQVSQPKVIIKEENGVKVEPYEEVIIDIKPEFEGNIIGKLSARRGVLLDHREHGGSSRLTFEIPTRGLLGFRGEFVIETRGEGVLSSRVVGFKSYAGEIERHKYGSMISMANGKALAFSLWNLQERGTLYIGPSEPVYEGMIIGNVTKGDDLDVNPTKNKELSNMRSKGSDEAILLTPPVRLNIERGLEIMQDDEFLEITPKSVRLRKKYLTKIDRARATRKEEDNF